MKYESEFNDIVNRLNGFYAQGPISENGLPEFGWRDMRESEFYEGDKPIMAEAREVITKLVEQRDAARKALKDANAALYAVGAPLGSANYFKIRGILTADSNAIPSRECSAVMDFRGNTITGADIILHPSIEIHNVNLENCNIDDVTFCANRKAFIKNSRFNSCNLRSESDRRVSRESEQGASE